MSDTDREPVRVFTLVAVVGALYFAEGFPYGVVTEIFPLYFRSMGVGLEEIGLLSLLGTPWIIKFLWAPLVDRAGSYRAWIRGCMLSIAILLVAIGNVSVESSWLFWILAISLCIASATQDIAIDALAIDRSDETTVGLVNSTRITTFRIAIIVAGGGIAFVADASGWRVAFLFAAVLSVLAILPTFVIGEASRIREGESLIAGVRGWLARPEAGLVITIVFLYKVGDSALIPMVKPFWVDHGYEVGEIGIATTVIGIGFTVVGAIVGGIYIMKLGLVRSMIHLGFLQMASNAGYVAAALSGASRPFMYTATVIENFAGGLGTAAFLSFLMMFCEKKRAATEFALLTALYGLSRTIAGAVSGYGSEVLGYAGFFTLTLALGIPGLAVVIYNRDRIRSAQKESA